MRIKKLFVLGLGILSFSSAAIAQNLLEIGNTKVSKEEFLKMYESNSLKGKVDYSETAIRDYLNYYTLYRMKLKEAKDTHLDTVASVKKEIDHYKKQLAQSYLKDKTINERLTKQAYERLKEEIEVEHIFVPFFMNKTPHSDIIVRKQIDSVYQKVKNNEMTFEEAATQYSKDDFTKANGGYIGYITALQSDYLFEDKIYSMSKGQLSEPFKSSRGYHVVKILDRRPNRGSVQVQQILIESRPSATAEADKAAKAEAEKLVAELRKGASFEKYVAAYSDDKFSNTKDGLLPAFRSGAVSRELEDVAFSLKKPGDISNPIKTEFGYHIFKLVKKFPVGTYEEERESLSQEVEADGRSFAANESKQKEIKEKMNLVEHTDVLENIKKSADQLKEKFVLYNNQDIYNPNTTLFSLKGKNYLAKDFADYFESINRSRPLLNYNTDKIVEDVYNTYVNNQVDEYRYDDLYSNNQEFRSLINSYNDAIMIYEMNSNKVWKRANDDTLGLEEFYEKNKSKYTWQPSFRGKVFTSKDKGDIDRLLAQINKGIEPSKAYDELVTDPKLPAKIAINSGRFEVNKYNISVASLKADKPSAILKDDGKFTLICPEEVFPNVATKSLEDAKGFVVSDYQEYLEKQWNATLQKKYPVSVNETVLKSIFK